MFFVRFFSSSFFCFFLFFLSVLEKVGDIIILSKGLELLQDRIILSSGLELLHDRTIHTAYPHSTDILSYPQCIPSTQHRHLIHTTLTSHPHSTDILSTQH